MQWPEGGASSGTRLGSANRCRLAHSVTTRNPPTKPASRRSRQSWAPLRQPSAQRRSSTARQGSSECIRGRTAQAARPQPAPHRVPGQRQLAGDLADSHVLLVQPHHVGMHPYTPLPSLPLQPLRARHRRRRSWICRGSRDHRCCYWSVGRGLGRSPDSSQLPLDRVEDGGAAVLQQMPAVGDMDGIGRAAASAISVDRAAVTSDHLDAGCARSQAAKLSASRSGSRSTTVRRSRSTRTVP